MDSPSLIYTPRPDATPEAELKVLANVYRFILDCYTKKMAAEPAPERDVRSDVSIRNRKEANDIDQRLDRPSEIVLTHSREE